MKGGTNVLEKGQELKPVSKVITDFLSPNVALVGNAHHVISMSIIYMFCFDISEPIILQEVRVL